MISIVLNCGVKIRKEIVAKVNKEVINEESIKKSKNLYPTVRNAKPIK